MWAQLDYKFPGVFLFRLNAQSGRNPSKWSQLRYVDLKKGGEERFPYHWPLKATPCPLEKLVTMTNFPLIAWICKFRASRQIRARKKIWTQILGLRCWPYASGRCVGLCSLHLVTEMFKWLFISFSFSPEGCWGSLLWSFSTIYFIYSIMTTLWTANTLQTY